MEWNRDHHIDRQVFLLPVNMQQASQRLRQLSPVLILEVMNGLSQRSAVDGY
jgi:hypothetical protein